MAGMDGLALLRELRRRGPRRVVILMTAYATVPGAVEAMRERRVRLPGEAVRARRGRRCCSSACSRCSGLRRENRDAAPRGRRPAAARLGESRHAARAGDGAPGRRHPTRRCCSPARAAPARTCSRASIHAWSPRARGPVRDDLVHDAGRAPARERAVRSREGRVHRGLAGQAGPPRGGRRRDRLPRRGGRAAAGAAGEAAALPRGAPLRARRRRSHRHESTRASIAATNRDLETEVAAGRFRQDLFFRLNVIGIRLPPLRERREDLDALVDQVLAGAGRTPPARGDGTRPADARAALRAYRWPGNVRELVNALERALVLTGGATISRRGAPRPPAGAARRRVPGARGR